MGRTIGASAWRPRVCWALALAAVLGCHTARSKQEAAPSRATTLEVPSSSTGASSQRQASDARPPEHGAGAGPPSADPPGSAAEGEICAGFAGRMCKKGLVCVTAQPAVPDLGGVCMDAGR